MNWMGCDWGSPKGLGLERRTAVLSERKLMEPGIEKAIVMLMVLKKVEEKAVVKVA